MLDKFKLLSVNQLAAQIKLTEVWKSVNVPGYPIVIEPYNFSQSQQTINLELRPRPTRIFNDSSRLLVSKYSFNVGSARLWNLAPSAVTHALNLSAAKAAILDHAKVLPV